MLRARPLKNGYSANNTAYRPLKQNVPVLHRLKSLWLLLVLGCALLSCGVFLLVWSEGRLLQKTQSLDEGLQSIVSVQNPEVVVPENQDKLVHVVGHLEVGEPLTEFEYGVSIPAVKLKRRVQMYQWVEEVTISENNGDMQYGEEGLTQTSYSYVTVWKDKLIDSSKFSLPYGHENPKEFPLKTVIYESEHVNIGGYYFGQDLKDQFTEYILVTSDERPERRDIKLHSGLYYHSQDVWKPEVGDIRVQFSYSGLAGEVVTIVGKQLQHQLHPYKTQQGDEILIMREGRVTVGEIFQEQHKQNWMLSWALRVSCGILIFMGANFLSRLIRGLGNSNQEPSKFFSFKLSSIHDLLTNHTKSVNFSLTISISFIIVALTWISFKPVLGGFLIFAALLPLIFCISNLCIGEESSKPNYRQI